MANYASALGKIALEKTGSIAKDFATGAKGAFMRENPGLAAASGFASTLKKYSESKADEVQAKEQVKEQKINNVISFEMVRQLKAMNANIANLTRLAARADARANAAAMFAEEKEKEKQIRDDKLLDAIKKLNGDKGSNVVKSATGSFLGGLLKDILGSKLPEIIGGTILGKEALKRIPGRTSPKTPPQTPPDTNKPPGKVYDIKTGRQTPTPPSVPSGGGGAGTGILRGLGAAARYLGLAGLAIGAALEVPGFIQDIKKWWNGAKWGGWDEPPGERDKPIWKRNKNNVTPSDASLGLLGMNTDLPKRTSMFNNASSNRLTVRNNNPGALRNPGGKGFQKFDTPEQGMRALEHQLKLYITGKSRAAGYKILNTIEKIIPVYAPASDNNNVQRYIQNVCSWTGFKPNKVLTVNDIPVLAKAITQMEGSTEAMQYFYPDNRGSGQRYGGGPGGGGDGGGPTSRTTRGLSVTPPVSYQASIRAIDNRTLNDGASGTNLQDYVSFEERERLAKKFYFDTAAIAKNTAKTAKAVESQNRSFGVGRGGVPGSALKSQVDPRTKYYQDRTEALSKQFENTTRKLINATLTKAIFPDGVPRGISRQVANQPGFLGNRISQYLDLQKKMTPTMNRIFGKQFGGQYASIFSQAGGLILDKGANALGSMLGFDQNSPYSFSQVVGNMLTKGKGKQAKAQRKLGREQAIYSILGIPTGATTGLSFAQKMFPNLFPDGKGGLLSAGATPQQQIAGLTTSLLDMFGINKSTLGGPLGSMLGMIPGPAAQAQGGGGLMDFLFGGARPAQDTSLYGYAPVGMNNLSKVVSYNGYQVTRGAANELEAQAHNYEGLIADQTQVQGSFFGGLGQVFGNVGLGLTKVFGTVGDGLASVFTGVGSGLGNGLGNILKLGFDALLSVFSGMGGGTGGGGIFGNMFGGGGFFSEIGKAWSGEMSWGDALINTGAKMIGNAATVFAANAITKNIKNPYLRIGSTLLTNYALKSGAQYIASEFGFGEVGSKFFGPDTNLTTALKTGDYSNLFSFGSNAAASSAGYNLAGEAGLRTGVNLTTNPLGGTPYNDFASGSVIPTGTDLGGMDIGTTSLMSQWDAADIAMSSVLEGGVSMAAVTDAATLSGANFVDFASSGTSFLDSLPGVSDVIPYAGAILKLFQGDIKGAATSAALTYVGMSIGGPPLAIFLNVVNSIFGGGSKKPEPWVTYAIRVNDNNDPNAYGLTYAGRRGVAQELHDACIGLVKTIFALIKKAQLTLRVTKLAYDFFSVHMQAESQNGGISIDVGNDLNSQSWGRVNKSVAGGDFNDLKTAAGIAKLTEPVLNAMLEGSSDKDKAAAKSSISKLTAKELQTGVVEGMNQSLSTDIYGRSIYERNFKPGETFGGDPEFSGMYRVDNPINSVYNAKTGQMQDEANLLIGGYNAKGEAVDLKGNVIDFNKFSSSAGFTGQAAVKEASEGGFYGSGEDAMYWGPTARQVFNAKTGKYQDESNNNIVGYDKDGKAVKVGQTIPTSTAATTATGNTTGNTTSTTNTTNTALKTVTPLNITAASDTSALAMNNSATALSSAAGDMLSAAEILSKASKEYGSTVDLMNHGSNPDPWAIAIKNAADYASREIFFGGSKTFGQGVKGNEINKDLLKMGAEASTRDAKNQGRLGGLTEAQFYDKYYEKLSNRTVLENPYRSIMKDAHEVRTGFDATGFEHRLMPGQKVIAAGSRKFYTGEKKKPGEGTLGKDRLSDMQNYRSMLMQLATDSEIREAFEYGGLVMSDAEWKRFTDEAKALDMSPYYDLEFTFGNTDRSKVMFKGNQYRDNNGDISYVQLSVAAQTLIQKGYSPPNIRMVLEYGSGLKFTDDQFESLYNSAYRMIPDPGTPGYRQLNVNTAATDVIPKSNPLIAHGAFISAVMKRTDITDIQKAQMFNDYMRTNSLSVSDMVNATKFMGDFGAASAGYTEEQIRSYLALANSNAKTNTTNFPEPAMTGYLTYKGQIESDAGISNAAIAAMGIFDEQNDKTTSQRYQDWWNTYGQNLKVGDQWYDPSKQLGTVQTGFEAAGITLETDSSGRITRLVNNGLSDAIVPVQNQTSSASLTAAESVRESLVSSADSLDRISSGVNNGSTVVANSGNNVDNRVSNTYVNNATVDQNQIRYGSYVSAEYGAAQVT